MKAQTRLAIPDIHVPFHDPRLWSALLTHVRNLRPKGIDIIGDVLDCYTLSRFDKDPARKGTFDDEVNTARAMLVSLRCVAGDACDIRFSEGNHENRLRRMLWSKSKELAHLRCLTMPALLGLDQPMIKADKTVGKSLGVKYYDPVAPYCIGNLWYLHGDLGRKCNWSMSYGGRLAEAIAKRVGNSVIVGHSHQMGKVMYQTWEHSIKGHEIGCICNFSMDYIVGTPQWQQGWAVVDFVKSGNYQVNFVEVAAPNYKSRRSIMFQGDEIATLPPAKVHKVERL